MFFVVFYNLWHIARAYRAVTLLTTIYKKNPMDNKEHSWQKCCDFNVLCNHMGICEQNNYCHI